MRVAGRVGCPSVGQGLGPPKRPGPTLKTLKKNGAYNPYFSIMVIILIKLKCNIYLKTIK